MTYELDIISLFFDASFVVQMVMIILIGLSLTSWWFIFDRWITLSRVEKDIFNFEKFFWSNANIEDLFTKVQKKEKKIGLEQIFYVGFEEYKKSSSLNDVKKVMEIVSLRNEDDLEKRLAFLSTVASVSPYIGLFGTVWGIMNAFGGLAQLTQVSITVVAPGISEALVATALGLFTAIPALISYNWSISRIERILKNYSNFTEEFLILLRRKS
ncbi:MAG: protein TolQ [Flavobacteriaceae bacterium]|nr:protein TolQ [Flavobacteriaceae bacterium]